MNTLLWGFAVLTTAILWITAILMVFAGLIQLEYRPNRKKVVLFMSGGVFLAYVGIISCWWAASLGAN